MKNEDVSHPILRFHHGPGREDNLLIRLNGNNVTNFGLCPAVLSSNFSVLQQICHFTNIPGYLSESANIYLEDIQETLTSPSKNCSLKKMTFSNCILGLDLSLLLFCMSIFNKQVESNKKVKFRLFPPVMYTCWKLSCLPKDQ